MERSGNFYKAIRLGYILISILIGCMAYNSLYEWQEIEALELGNKKIDELRKEINNINIQMIKFSLLGETILEWNDKDIEHYHARRMAMDSMLCRFKATYPAERIDSVRSLLEDKERQMFRINRAYSKLRRICPEGGAHTGASVGSIFIYPNEVRRYHIPFRVGREVICISRPGLKARMICSPRPR